MELFNSPNYYILIDNVCHDPSKAIYSKSWESQTFTPRDAYLTNEVNCHIATIFYARHDWTPSKSPLQRSSNYSVSFIATNSAQNVVLVHRHWPGIA